MYETLWETVEYEEIICCCYLSPCSANDRCVGAWRIFFFFFSFLPLIHISCSTQHWTLVSRIRSPPAVVTLESLLHDQHTVSNEARGRYRCKCADMVPSIFVWRFNMQYKPPPWSHNTVNVKLQVFFHTFLANNTPIQQLYNLLLMTSCWGLQPFSSSAMSCKICLENCTPLCINCTLIRLCKSTTEGIISVEQNMLRLFWGGQ